MKNIIVRSLKDDEKKRLFKFAALLPESDLWGKKGRLLKGDFARFQEFFEYIEAFEPKCFLAAEENNTLVGFVVAVYNPLWIDELKERYGYDVEKRAYILGIAVVQRRKEVLIALTAELSAYFSKKGIKSAEYPTLGNVCLTTATDVLTPENVDALIMFREAGFKISECYYSMELDLDNYTQKREYLAEKASFRFKERCIQIVQENEVIGEVKWEPTVNGRTDIGINVNLAHRRKGFGTMLMAKALHQLKTEGVKVVELGVDGNNLPALKLYRKFGFQVCATHFYISAPC